MFMGYLSILLAFAAPNESEYQTDSVHLIVSVQSNIYRYRLTNHGNSPIVRFEIPQHAIYSLTAPPDWKTSDAAGKYTAWTENSLHSLAPESSGTFSFAVSSQGATLGEAYAIIWFEDGHEVRIPKVWVPAREPHQYYFLIVGILLGIFLLHYAIKSYRDRRSALSSSVS